MSTQKDKARSEVTFQYTFKNVSEMEESQLSPACYFCDLPWEIKVMPQSSLTQQGQAQKSLGVFLVCNRENESTLWSCSATAELRLLSCKKRQPPFSRKMEQFFCSKKNGWGFSHFMAWQEVLNSDKGYIKDDSITLEPPRFLITERNVSRSSWESLYFNKN